MKNSIDKDALLNARLEARDIADSLNVAYWLNEDSEGYHIAAARERFANLSALMAKLSAEEQPREVSNATQAKKDQVA